MNRILPVEKPTVDSSLTTQDMDESGQLGVRCGRVVSTTGSTVIVLLDEWIIGSPGLRMASLVRFRAPGATVYGIVEGLSTPMPSTQGGLVELHLAEIGLLGEMSDAAARTNRRFRRGVSQVPALDGVLYLATQEDVKNVYAISDRTQSPF